MALTEIEFDLSAQQLALMDYPALVQGQPLSVQLDAGLLLPDPGSESWFTVQKAAWPSCFIQVGRATYAFSGQILEAELEKQDGMETATLLVQCGEVPLRVTCGPGRDGRLPEGTWETRYLAGVSRVHGLVEDDYAVPIGRPVGVTIWQFRRLRLQPGDPLFGQWHVSETLPPSPLGVDRLVVVARLHRPRV